MFVLAVFCMSYFLFAYLDKKKQLDEFTQRIEADERDACILRRAKADAQILVNTALAHHYDACHDKDEHFM